MESDHSEQSNEEQSAVCPKMESDECTSANPQLKDPFLSMPPDIVSKIIIEIPVVQWPSLELLDTNFNALTLLAWRQLRHVDVNRDFLSRSAIDDCSIAIVQKLTERSPRLTSLRGVDTRLYDAALNSDIVHSLAQFELLQSISLGDARMRTQRQGVSLEYVVEFLEWSRSRMNLKELQLYNVSQRQEDRAEILDRFASSFAYGRQIRLPLRLEKFFFTSSDSSLHIRLDSMDTTLLTDLRVGHASIEPEQLTNLIERASELQRIELSFLHCPSVRCNGPRLAANKTLLTALAAHENLTTIKFDYFGDSSIFDSRCVNFRPEFIQMLKMIGRRGRLRKLGLGNYFRSLDDMNEICKAICKYLPYLQSIKFERLQRTCNLIGLTALEEICFINLNSSVTGNAIKTFSQLPRLKRLAFFCLNVDLNALKYLSHATALTDLRIGLFGSVSGDIFKKWSKGFASNLQSLMLSQIRFYNKDDEKGLAQLLDKAVRLRVLILDGHMTERSLMAIAKSCPRLEILGVRLAKDRRSLTSWNKRCIQYLQEIVDRCPKLRKLGGFEDELIWAELQIPKYHKIGDMDMCFWNHDFDDDEYI